MHAFPYSSHTGEKDVISSYEIVTTRDIFADDGDPQCTMIELKAIGALPNPADDGVIY